MLPLLSVCEFGISSKDCAKVCTRDMVEVLLIESMHSPRIDLRSPNVSGEGCPSCFCIHYTEVLTNFVYPLCALALAVFWLCL